MSLTAAFRATKIPRALPPKCGEPAASSSASASGDPPPGAAKSTKAPPPWCVYLIASSRIRRTIHMLENANLIHSFSIACEFESKWKIVSRKIARKRTELSMKSVLQHREAALSRVETFMDCSHLKIKWQSS
ncbi:Excinuclease ABC C subunit N-terminal [Zea mays]|uniref:Excinuclease ABC C subunit N-terminal n=1 Tax=Zea mays TaxID=4577 RepID=A0A1D6IQX6_MAIZE|nr:Excinuclease ABC C subunit N-terminal [Zea mays]